MSKTFNRSKLALLLGSAILLAAPVLQPQATAESAASEVVTKLWKSAADGNLLGNEGWTATSQFFVHPSPRPETRSFMIVSNDWSVGPVIVHGDGAEIDVNYIPAGQIDASLHYLAPPRTPYMKRGVAYHLVISTPSRNSADGSDEKAQSAVWKIADPRGLPWATVDGASHFVTAMRDKSKDPAVTKNADETLIKLAALH